jgi:hypothetical protein
MHKTIVIGPQRFTVRPEHEAEVRPAYVAARQGRRIFRAAQRFGAYD